MERTGNYRHVYEKKCFGTPKLILEIEEESDVWCYNMHKYSRKWWRTADVNDLLWLHNNGYFVKNGQ